MDPDQPHLGQARKHVPKRRDGRANAQVVQVGRRARVTLAGERPQGRQFMRAKVSGEFHG